MKKFTLFLAILCSLSLFAEQKNGIVYVKAGATGTGASWSDALGDIQAAINLAKTENLNRKDVWVGAGEYTITTCLMMADSVNVYGGFNGTETDLNQRTQIVGGKPWQFQNATILTGSGCRLVESSQNFDMETTFGGFTLTKGNGVGTQLNNSGGAAVVRGKMALLNCIVTNCSTIGNGGGVNMTGGTIRQCWIYGNAQQTGTGGGGGIYVSVTTPVITTIEDSQINGNSSTIRGGGLNIQGTGMTYCSNLKIFNNKAMLAGTTYKPGGAIYTNTANNQIKNCLIYNNAGTNAMYYNGGTLYNNSIVKNVGGLYLAGNIVNATNNIVWGCALDSIGTTPTSITGAISTNFTVQNNATYNPNPTTNSWIVADNILFSSNVSNGDVTAPAAGTVGSGPKFNHVTRYIGTASNADELAQLDSVDWSIPMASPCVNVGKANTVAITDFTGLARPQGYPVATALPDMGAYELPYCLVVAGESATANGAIYSALGEKLAENFTYGYAKGSKLELMFQPNKDYVVDRAYYTTSTDGGVTFTGTQTDFTSAIGTDGFWSTTIGSHFKIAVLWKVSTALSKKTSEKINCLVSGNIVDINGLSVGDELSIYSLSGTLVHHAKTVSNHLSASLSKGFYIMRVGENTSKLVIQ